MEKAMNVLRRVGELSAYIILIFTVLILINWGNKRINEKMATDQNAVHSTVVGNAGS